MSMWKQKASKGGGGDGEGIDRPPPGNHPAVLVAIIDMGTQDTDFQGKPGKAHRAYFVWELVTRKVAGTKGTNHLIGIDLTVSLNENAKLRKWVEARKNKRMPDGYEYDISKELGQPCLLNVTLNKREYPVVSGMSAVPDGLSIPGPQRKPFLWGLDDDTDDLPDWLPWLYGRKIADHIADCHEKRKGRRSEDEGDAVEGDGLDDAEPTPGGKEPDEVPF